MENLRNRLTKRQRGSTLLEALISIVIFSIGAIALIGLQANAMKRIGDANYRFDAAFLANELAGQIAAMRIEPTGNNLPDYSFANCGDPCQSSSNPIISTWLNKVATTLPGVNLSSGTQAPTIQLVSASNTVGNQLLITIRWRTPGDNGSTPVTGTYSLISYLN